MAEEFRLYGDDFDEDAIRQWFVEEAEYHNQFSGGRFEEHPKLYQHFDWYYALDRYFHPRSGVRVLDFGCAEGQALTYLPADRGGYHYVGVDASQSLLDAAEKLHPQREYRRMPESGVIPAVDGEFGYVVVFGVLHHVPNVEHYLREISRVLEPGGRLILREPNHAMGRPVGSHQTLPGLSPNERGIPAHYLDTRLQALGFHVLALRPAYHGAVLQWIRRRSPKSAFGWRWVLAVDAVLNRLSLGRTAYDRPTLRDKLAPTATYVIADKERAG